MTSALPNPKLCVGSAVKYMAYAYNNNKKMIPIVRFLKKTLISSLIFEDTTEIILIFEMTNVRELSWRRDNCQV